MKAGRTLTELAIELERQSETKKDFIASTEVLEMTDTGEMTLEGIPTKSSLLLMSPTRKSQHG